MSEEATFFWRNPDDIILLCVHLVHDAGILERDSLAEASVPSHVLSYGSRASG